MNRQKSLLVGLVVILVLVLAYLFVVKPANEEITETQQRIEDTRAQQSVVRTQIARLEDVRERSPEVESLLAAAETVVPRGDANLPAAVRQLQVAANDSGVELASVTMARPTATEAVGEASVPDDLATIGVTITLNGGYFQIVDFLRRVEDPVISPRALLWNTASVALEEYPTLTASLNGAMFAYLDPADTEPAEAEPTETGTETDVDVDVDVDVTETEEPT